jgi:hypothetical protein
MAKELADRRIPVTKGVWKALHGLRKPGQTYSELIAERFEISKEANTVEA